MVTKFDGIISLNNFYSEEFRVIADSAIDLGIDVANKMLSGLMQAYDRDLKLLNYNEDYELKLRKKELKVARLQLKLNTVIENKTLKNNVCIDKKRKTSSLKQDMKTSMKQWQLETRVDKKPSIFKRMFRKRTKTENCQG